ncbi:MAG: glycosyltransferase family 4 protein [Liquorilactobacillus nagelii]|uniref:1,2-diacylglycerol 3-glucosyltransferase n=2 Tax=Lactobacillaceae TaxID=33958 RepID=A0A3S6QXL4_9LACO|nr:glycosyltransferase family 4 protein [Liquorilactobacillus nagelii]AUJ32499.1 1,2-diacylglycerol 3-glucosyltransferase [Liquorilactobacillus nagelii]KRL42360.1 glycosyltransferase [Liquorilactobacillus nagelii DSM 13675]MCC7617108.1 glycosyltransferase family 4 protein [Liquorilactobacillus nagelii]MCI1634316.1 glycosyltransferase family 4 protein [Liquorilactobacillus nagelii]MCI1700414.1 glycosyltransferase family 4 protein [Liquorilactobacillus nagelii]
MNIGIFTDTYYPQVSGVATSIKTLKEQLESQGHHVYIFTTTDPKVASDEYEKNIFRFTSIPFISFTDRRIAVRGLFRAYQVAKELQLDIVHTQTEFSMGWIGKFVAKNLKIPCIHTYHTMYEDYLHYVAKGKLLKPHHVKQMSRSFCYHMTGIIAPSERVLTTLEGYGVKSPITVIPTGVNLQKYRQPVKLDIRKKYQIKEQTPLLLTLSRLAYEKDIDRLISVMPQLCHLLPNVLLMIVGDGPAREDLEQQVAELNIQPNVLFTGEISNDQVADYYHAADLFVSTSVSESQGLTYIEALASGLKVVTTHSPYTDDLLSDKEFGMTFEKLDDLANILFEYLTTSQQSIETNKLNQKLSAISAADFGEKVIQFYHDCQAIYSKERETSHSGEIS